MQLSHLVPHLNAEIDRLQQARDLLALVCFSSPELSTTFVESRPAHRKTLPPPITLSREEDLAELGLSAREAATEPASVAALIGPAVRRRMRSRTAPLRPLRSRRMIPRVNLEDSALRGNVPSGPVVISAEEVRRSQAVKTEQATRAAEIKKAGAELVSAFSWRSRSADVRSADALLQRLMHIGEESEDAGTASQYPSLGHKQSLEAAQATRLAK